MKPERQKIRIQTAEDGILHRQPVRIAAFARKNSVPLIQILPDRNGNSPIGGKSLEKSETHHIFGVIVITVPGSDNRGERNRIAVLLLFHGTARVYLQSKGSVSERRRGVIRRKRPL